MGIKSIALAASILVLSTSVHAATVSYTLDNVLLDNNGGQITGAFDWDYTIGDFEGGTGIFTGLEIPVQPNGSLPPLDDSRHGSVSRKQSDCNFHGYQTLMIMA